MKTLVGLFLSVLLGNSLAFANPITLPDFKKEARLTQFGTCDGGNIQIEVYEKDYFIEVIKPKDAPTFYIMMTDIAKGAASDIRFLVEILPSIVEEVSMQLWSRELRNHSRDYVKEFHLVGGPNSCSRTKVK